MGQSSLAITVTVTMTAIGQAGDPLAVTQGVPVMDFSITGGTCASDPLVTSIRQTCTATVVFTPKYPGVRSGAVLIETTDGKTLLGSVPVVGIATGSLAVLDPGEIDTVAGDTEWNYAGDGGVATQAAVYLPYGVTADPAGKTYLSDTLNARIRLVGVDGIISTIAGKGTFGYSGDGGLAINADVNQPAGLAMDGAGNVYFADGGNNIIRRIDAVSGVITTVAGEPQTMGYSGDGGAATSATLSSPEAVAFDAAGDLYIADTGNGVIREVDAATGVISTVAGVAGNQGYNGEGTATTAELNLPWGITVGPDNSLYIADTYNNRIRRVSGGVISTIAGTGSQGSAADGTAAGASALNQPYGVAVDPAGDLYIADSNNDRVLKVSASTGSVNAGTATIQTIIGTGSEGDSGDGGAANLAKLHGPYALFFAQNGDFYFADTHNDRIRRVLATPFKMPPFPDTKITKISSSKIEGLDSDGNVDLNLSTPTLVNALLDVSTTTCSFTTATPKGSSCSVGVEFAPTPAVPTPNLPGSVTLNSDAGNTPAVIDISGNALDVNPTTMTLVSLPISGVVGQRVTFTATVKNDDSSPLTGPVTFLDGATPLVGCGSVSLSGGKALCTTTALALGSHTIIANYAGDANNEANTATLDFNVLQLASVALAASPNPAVATQNVTLTATVTASPATPTGNVVFYDGAGTISGSVALNGSGVASFTTDALGPGTHSLTAKYLGDTSNAIGVSAAFSEVIDLATTTTAIATTDASPTVGDSITFTATVASTNGPQPTGTVTFSENGTTLGSGTLNGSGVAVLTLDSLAPGLHSIVASYSGDIDSAISNSVPLTETVAQIATVTTLTPDANPASAGGTLHLTATVALAPGAVADGALTGQISFTDGTTTLGTVALDGSGHATLAVNALTVGNHTIVASYGGATNYAISSSTSLAQQVQKTGTSVTVTPAATTVLTGEPASFTATVTSSTGMPTGTVSFHDGATLLGQVALDTHGVAMFSLSTLTTGTHTLIASYDGDENYSTSTSTPWTETVNLAQPVLTLSGPVNPVDAGTAVALSGTFTSPGIPATGTLALRDGTTTIATAAVSGTFSFSSSSLAVGAHTLTIFYGGDSDNASASSAAITVKIQQAPTATALGSSANPGTFGQPVTLSVGVVSDSPSLSGTVAFFDGATSIGTETLAANGTAALTTSALGFGVHNITAVYSGDTQHASSTSAVVSERIVEPATATLASSLNPAITGVDVAFTATVLANGGQTPTGNVTFRDGAATLGTVALNESGAAVLHTSTLAVGAHTITVSYAGDEDVAAASSSLTQTIQAATTEVTLAASANPATYAAPLTLTANVSTNGGAATGPVAFMEGGTTLGSGILNAQGIAALTLSTLAPGSHTIIADYAGDGSASASASPPLTVVVKQITSLALASSANPALTLSPITITATLNNSGAAIATGPVVFSDGSTQLGTAALDGNDHASLTLPSLSAGVHAITANYAGDGGDFASPSVSLTQTVNLRATTTTLSASQTDASNPQQVTLIGVVHPDGTAAPTGMVSFTSGNLAIGSVSVDATGVATLTIQLQSKSEDIVASYSGDAVYAASTSAATAVQSGPATQFTLTIAPASVSIASKQHTTVSLGLASIKDFSDTIQFGCLGLPFAATCVFSTPQTKLAANGTATVQLTLDTGDPLGVGSQASTRIGRGESTVLLCFLPGMLLAGLGLQRRARRKFLGLVLVLCAAALTLTSAGCAGLQGSGTPPGTYTFKVTASGQGSGATQSQVLTLTVTQ